MFGKWVFGLVVPLALVAGLTGCEQGGVQQGVVQTAPAANYRGESGRVVAIREVPVRRGNTGVSDGR